MTDEKQLLEDLDLATRAGDVELAEAVERKLTEVRKGKKPGIVDRARRALTPPAEDERQPVAEGIQGATTGEFDTGGAAPPEEPVRPRDAGIMYRADQDTRLAPTRANAEQLYGAKAGPIQGVEPTAANIAADLASQPVYGLRNVRAGIRQIAGDIAGSESLQRKGAQEAAAVETATQAGTPEFESETARGLYSGLQSLTRQAPGIAVGIATGGVAAPLALAGADVTGQAYGKYRERGAAPSIALAAALGEGSIEILTELAPMGVLVQKLGRVGFGRFMADLLAKEVPGEQIATLTQDAIDTAVANPDKTWAQYIAERPGAAYQTLLATISQAGAMGAINQGIRAVAGAIPQDERPSGEARAAIDRMTGARTDTTPEGEGILAGKLDALVPPEVSRGTTVEEVEEIEAAPAPAEVNERLAELTALRGSTTDARARAIIDKEIEDERQVAKDQRSATELETLAERATDAGIKAKLQAQADKLKAPKKGGIAVEEFDDIDQALAGKPERPAKGGITVTEQAAEEIEAKPVAGPNELAAEAAEAEGAKAEPVEPEAGRRTDIKPTPERAAARRSESRILTTLQRAGGLPLSLMSDLGLDKSGSTKQLGTRITKSGKVIKPKGRAPDRIQIGSGTYLFNKGADGIQEDEVIALMAEAGFLPADIIEREGPAAALDAAAAIIRQEIEQPGTARTMAEQDEDMAAAGERETLAEIIEEAEALGITTAGKRRSEIQAALARRYANEWIGQVEQDMRDAGIDFTDADLDDAVTVRRAVDIDEAAVERAAQQHADDTPAFMRAIKEIIRGQASRPTESVPRDQSEAAAQAEKRAERERPAPAAEADRGREVAGRRGEPDAGAAEAGRVAEPEPATQRQRAEPARAAGRVAEPDDLFGAAPVERPVEAERRRREQAEAKKREAAPDPRDFALAGATTPQAQADARGQQGLFDVQAGTGSSLKPRELEVSTRAGLVDAPKLRGDIKDRGAEARFVTIKQLKIPATPVRLLSDAAAVLAPMRRAQQEQVLALVLDQNHKPLAVLRHTVGSNTEASVYMPSLLGGIFAVPGASYVVFAHNHPSGTAEPSGADKRLQDALERNLKNSSVVSMGHLILAGTKAALIGPKGDVAENLRIPPARRTAEVPLVERQLMGGRTPQSGQLNDPGRARQAVTRIMGKRSGVVFLNNRNEIVGTLDMTARQMLNLRTAVEGEGMGLVLSAANNVNAVSFMLRLPDGIDTDKAITNMGKLARAVSPGLRLVDAFIGPTGRSWAEGGNLVETGTDFFAVRRDTVPGLYSELLRQVEKIDAKAMSPADWISRIKAIKGIKAEELELSGVLDWLAGGRATRDRAPTTAALLRAQQIKILRIRNELVKVFGESMVASLERQGILRIEASQLSGNATIRDNNVLAVASEADIRGPGASLFWDRIEPSQAPMLLMHEVGEHYGLIRMLGHGGYADLLRDVRDAHKAKRDPAVEESWKFVLDNYVNNPDPKVGQGMVEGDARFLREVIARVVETSPTRPFVRRLLDAIRAWLFDTFGIGKVDAHLLRGLATAALRQAAAGRLTRAAQDFADVREQFAVADRAAAMPDVAKLTREQQAAVIERLDGMPADEADRAFRNLSDPQLAGTAWAKQTVDGILIRAAMERLLSGREVDFGSMLDRPEAQRAVERMRRGPEAVWAYLANVGLVGDAAKPVNNVNSSFINCDPSPGCAKYCYATRGNYPTFNATMKSELTNWAVENDPMMAARLIASGYKATAEFHTGKALRLFDKGDGNEAWLPVIRELNAQGVRVQIFSKRPAFLRQVPAMNVRLLSVDKVSEKLARDNPDLPIAYIYGGPAELPFLEEIRNRVQVILPIKIGNRVMTPEERAKLPSWSKIYQCPIDNGVKKLPDKLGNPGWTCTKCDKDGGIGCFKGQSTVKMLALAASPPKPGPDVNQAAKEIRDAIERSIPVGQREDAPRLLDALMAAIRAGVDISSEGTGRAGDANERGLGDARIIFYPRDRRPGVPPAAGEAGTAGEVARFEGEGGRPRDEFAVGPARDVTAAPEFKRWFGDSKVVDEKGRPRVVYHGTAADVESFDPARIGQTYGIDNIGFFFTARLPTAEAAADDATGLPTYMAKYRPPGYQQSDEGDRWGDDIDESRDFSALYNGGQNIMPVYLSIKNPKVVTAREGDGAGVTLENVLPLNFLEQAQKDGHDGAIIYGRHRSYERIARVNYNENLTDAQRAKAIAAIDAQDRETWENDIYFIAFKPEQIKSATGNRGTFDPANPNISMAVGAPQRQPPAQPAGGLFSRGAGGYMEFRPGRALWDAIGRRTNDLLRHVGLNNDNLTPEMRAALREYYARVGTSRLTAKDVASAASELSPDERSLISDYIERELEAGVTPPDKVVRVAQGIQRAIAQQTAELVDAGMLSQASAERWADRYLPRFYEGKLVRSSDPSIQGRRLDAELIRSLRIMGSHLKGRGLFERVTAREFMRDYAPLGWEVRGTPNGAPFDSLNDDDIVIAWRDFTKEERQRMGEIRDGLFRFVRGYLETQKDIAMGRLLQTMARDPAISRETNEDGAWLKVPDTEIAGTGGLKTYGELSGRYVSRDVYEQITHMREIKHPAWSMYLKALALWKEGKTVWNPISHGNNTFSNFIGAHMAGVSMWNARAYRDAWRELRRKEGPIYNEALANGLLSMDFVSAELAEILPSDGEFDDVQAAQRSMIGKVFDYAMRYTGTAWYRQKMRDLYQFEDQIFRFLIYREARLRGQSEVEAANYAEQYVFNYSDLPRTARIIRDSPVGLPFFSWSYKAVPMVARSFLVAPHRVAPIIGLLWGANFLAYSMMGGDADEEDERAKLPDYMKGATSLGTPKAVRVPFNDVNGNPVFLDISRRVPLGDFFDTQNQMGGMPLIQTFTPNNPVITTAIAMLANRDAFTGRDVVPKYEDSAEAAKIRARWLAAQVLPAAPQIPMSFSFDKAMNAIASATGSEIDLGFKEYTGITSRGDAVDPLLTAFDVTGVAKLRAPNLEAEELGRDLSMRGTVRELDAAMRRIQRSKVLSDEAKERELTRLRERRLTIMREREKEAQP